MNVLQRIRKLTLLYIMTFILLMSPTLVWAEQINIVTSIKPVQALVSAVIGDHIDPPNLLFAPTVSPHGIVLKPSQAKMLQNADIIFWIGAELETTLAAPLSSVKGQVVTLLDTPGLDLLRRDGALDPHIWLSPKNVMVMVDLIRDKLSALNADNAQIYAKNAKLLKRRMRLLARKAKEMVAATQDLPFIVQHDGFGYLTREFGLNQVGFLQVTPGRKPGARHVAEIRTLIQSKKIRCLFTEPQLISALAQNLSKEMGVTLAELNIMGTDLITSPTLPLRIIQLVIISMDKCLYVKKPTKSLDTVDTPTKP